MNPDEPSLRAQAETVVARRDQGEPLDGPELLRLVHELQVHQVELELQNDELQRARAAEHDAITKYAELFDRAPVAYAVISREGHLQHANIAAAQLFGGDLDSVVGRNAGVLFRADDWPRWTELRRCVGDGDETTDEFQLAGDEGRHVRIIAAPSGDQGLCLLAIIDLTADRERQAERELLEAQLRTSQRMEAIGTLASGIAHDFNNILTGIMGYTELAKVWSTEPTKQHEALDQVTAAAQRAVSLVRRMAAFQRPSTNLDSPTPTANGHVVAEAFSLLRAGVPSSIEFSLSLDPMAADAMIEPSQLHQIVMNLVTNAAYALGEEPGSIAVIVDGYLVGEGLDADVADLRPGHYTRLSIIDSGPGMDDDTARQVFDPFFTTKPVGQGTGLGLSVVHGIVSAAGGAIRLTTSPGHGCRFDVYLHASDSLPGTTANLGDDAPLGHGERVLLIDDDATVGRFTQITLEMLGYVVVLFTEPIAAVEHFASHPLEFDLVLTDLAMPGLRGTAAAKAIHDVRRDLPIMLISGYTGTLTTDEAASLGIVEMLTKPVLKLELATRVRRVLDQVPPVA
jgi:PAS domain S-box-containing protein